MSKSTEKRASVEKFLNEKYHPQTQQKTKLNMVLNKLTEVDNDKVDSLRMLGLYMNGDINQRQLIKYLKNA